ncbi:class I adenylate-forming enzyme family protein [Flavisphingomonas formosensis]|uniref:class I adenylate-forming enzyme family protein n=1 Tax=Flavisphingomonas formosensis TaxID=861534 RepID=UPI0012F7E31D|nr:AMP-binding protein [Sphingomonas formosensis]
MTACATDDRPQPWLELYPSGMPARFVPRHADGLAMFRETAAAVPDAEAIAYFDGSLSYADLDRASDAIALWLIAKGVRQGDRISLILQNVPHVAIGILAAWKAGAIPVPGNPMYRAPELAKLFRDYQPAAIVGHDDHLSEILSALAEAGVTETPLLSVDAHDFQSADDARLLPPAAASVPARIAGFKAVLDAHDGSRPPAVSIDPSDLALILYTSGTTGQPKGAMIRHSSVAFNSGAAALWMRIGRDSRILGMAPIFHITGFILHLTMSWSAGASVALHYRVHPEAVLDVIRSYRPTFAIAAITAFNALMQVPGVSAADFASFETVFSGGAPIAPALRDEIREVLGITLLPVYGMTETCSPTHISPPGLEVPVSEETGALAVGLPISSTESAILGPDLDPLPPGEQGEVCMRGPQVMTGYWNKPAESAEALHDGWMRSGDIGFQDEQGWFYVVDRKKDMINASGFKVWPREVEDTLYAHPAVREAAVIGIPDSYRGETVRACVSLKPGMASDEADLIAHCRARLAAYKVPRSVILLDDLPKTLTGKIQRAMLREGA